MNVAGKRQVYFFFYYSMEFSLACRMLEQGLQLIAALDYEL
jgi:hypothetical protein